MGWGVTRGAKRTTKPDIFISHSSRDKVAATKLAETLTACSVDVWLDDWELEVGQSLTDALAKAMDDATFIAILVTENYNKSVWTKTEYKKALSREQKETRTVMLPLILGEAEVPDFLEDKVYIDFRTAYFSAVVQLVGIVHNISKFRISQALRHRAPASVPDVWKLLEKVDFAPYIVLGRDDFEELTQCSGASTRGDHVSFDPFVILSSNASSHLKNLIRVLLA